MIAIARALHIWSGRAQLHQRSSQSSPKFACLLNYRLYLTRARSHSCDLADTKFGKGRSGLRSSTGDTESSSPSIEELREVKDKLQDDCQDLKEEIEHLEREIFVRQLPSYLVDVRMIAVGGRDEDCWGTNKALTGKWRCDH